MDCKLLLLDLDGTLLRSDKSISGRTLSSLLACRAKGIRIGISTSRSEQNSKAFVSALDPDIVIASGGAVVRLDRKLIYAARFSAEETKNMIMTARAVCGRDCELTIDTLTDHYWNYRLDPKQEPGWGDSIYTDFEDFSQEALKMCVEIADESRARRLQEALPGCDGIRFSDGYWYKFTKKGVTKESAIQKICSACGIVPKNIIAFGDDFADIGMLKLCGVGVAMGNAIPEVKEIADTVIGTNDDDGIADYLTRYFALPCTAKNAPANRVE